MDTSLSRILRKDLLNAGIHADFVQDNQSYSSKGILRGLHFQKTICTIQTGTGFKEKYLMYGRYRASRLHLVNTLV